MAELEDLPVFHNGRESTIYAIGQGDVIDIKLQDRDGKKGAWIRGMFSRRNSAAGMITLQTYMSIRVISVEWIEKIVIQLTAYEGKRD